MSMVTTFDVVCVVFLVGGRDRGYRHQEIMPPAYNTRIESLGAL